MDWREEVVVDELDRGNVFQVARNRGSGEGGGGHERLWGNLAAFNIMCVCIKIFRHSFVISGAVH